MAKETERKFLIHKNTWLASCHQCPVGVNQMGITQGYLFDIKKHVSRIRLTSDGKAKFTYKGPNKGVTRTEVEFGIPRLLGKILSWLCGPMIHKTRTTASIPGSDSIFWEVDEFHNLKEELFLAEIELPSEDYEFTKPSWLSVEVSDDPRYYNSNLIKEVI